jgi:hypothetical protein
VADPAAWSAGGPGRPGHHCGALPRAPPGEGLRGPALDPPAPGAPPLDPGFVQPPPQLACGSDKRRRAVLFPHIGRKFRLGLSGIAHRHGPYGLGAEHPWSRALPWRRRAVLFPHIGRKFRLGLSGIAHRHGPYGLGAEHEAVASGARAEPWRRTLLLPIFIPPGRSRGPG